MNSSESPRRYPIVAIFLLVSTANLAMVSSIYAEDSSTDLLITMARIDEIEDIGSGGYQVASATPSNNSTLASNEVRCLALNIYFEARGEPRVGQRAVGHVVMNRVASKKYPNTVCDVIRQGGEKPTDGCQFSWWCDGRSDEPSNRRAWEDSLELASKIYSGYSKDPTGGSLWYHADYVKPFWSSALTLRAKLGRHDFYIKKR
jgi:spore germination cell wall hydrolase CwlJ-like protein